MLSLSTRMKMNISTIFQKTTAIRRKAYIFDRRFIPSALMDTTSSRYGFSSSSFHEKERGDEEHADMVPFVSKHFALENPNTILDLLVRKNIAYSQNSTHVILRICPFCHDIKGRTDNMFKCYIDKTKGVYFCHRCGSKGSWINFKQRINSGNGKHVSYSLQSIETSLGKRNPTGNHSHPSSSSSSSSTTILPRAPLENYNLKHLQQNLKSERFAHIFEYLTKTRGIRKEILDKYGVGCIELHIGSKDKPSKDTATKEYSEYITFPWMARKEDLLSMGVELEPHHKSSIAQKGHNKPNQGDANHFDVVRVKARNMLDKSKQMLLPKGGCWGLFGYNTIPNDATGVVLTEGEYDAMAVHQATGWPALSLPNGCQSLPPKVLPLLERFNTIYLWMDNDIAGQENILKFVTKLGLKRCKIVRPLGNESVDRLPKDANEALLNGWDLNLMLDKAQKLPHNQITTFSELRHEVFHEFLYPIEAAGVQSQFFPKFNSILKGHRLGEVTILTGPTGCGKTTLCSQLSIDFCQQGVNTLWGSFEIKNTRLIKKMLSQFSGTDLSKGGLSELEAAADEFEKLPMHFLRFFGSSDVDQVLDAMDHAVYALDVRHIVLDNLQFMMANQGKGFDKFERQDLALDKFRKFASSNNIHLTLVVHPRKEQEDADLSVTSVFGTAKATQEADNVMILQRKRSKDKVDIRLDVRKNRFEGTLGSIDLNFQPGSCRFFESPNSEDSTVEVDKPPLIVLERQQREISQQQRGDDVAECKLTNNNDVDDNTLAGFSEEMNTTDQPKLKLEPLYEEPFSKFTKIIHH